MLGPQRQDGGRPTPATVDALVARLTGANIAEATAAQQDAATEPLQTQTSAESNRARVQENQRILATQILTASFSVAICLSIIIFVAGVIHICLYVRGWHIMLHESKKPCDKPLKWWLLAMLVQPLLRCRLAQFDIEPWKKEALSVCMNAGCIIAGAVLYCQSTTCAETNPKLYGFTKIYVLYEAVTSSVGLIGSVGIIYLVFWMHRHGLLQSGPGPHRAARTGLVNDIETVRFNPNTFAAESGSEETAPECPICYVEYEPDEPIKRTPCGHCFHPSCLGKWLENAKSCPLCRKDLEAAIDHPDQAMEPP